MLSAPLIELPQRGRSPRHLNLATVPPPLALELGPAPHYDASCPLRPCACLTPGEVEVPEWVRWQNTVPYREAEQIDKHPPPTYAILRLVMTMSGIPSAFVVL